MSPKPKQDLDIHPDLLPLVELCEILMQIDARLRREGKR